MNVHIDITYVNTTDRQMSKMTTPMYVLRELIQRAL